MCRLPLGCVVSETLGGLSKPRNGEAGEAALFGASLVGWVTSTVMGVDTPIDGRESGGFGLARWQYWPLLISGTLAAPL